MLKSAKEITDIWKDEGDNFMKIFLSWSGEKSKHLARCFKEWLPNVMQHVEPFMSEQDIALGTRGLETIKDELRDTTFGIIFVTDDNVTAPWINFEAGALSKMDNSTVIPILHETTLQTLASGPLNQFQTSKGLTKKDILSIIKTVNECSGEHRIDSERLNIIFNKWWSELEEQINKIPKSEIGKDTNTNTNEIVNDIHARLLLQCAQLDYLVDKETGKHNYMTDNIFYKMRDAYQTIRKCEVIEDENDISPRVLESIDTFLSAVSNTGVISVAELEFIKDKEVNSLERKNN